MITNNIDHVINRSYEEFLTELSPKFDKGAVKLLVDEKMKVPITDLFQTQRTTDKAKASLGKDFPSALRLYFSLFLTKDNALDAKRLKYGITPYEPNFVRHLGKDRLAFLKLLISIHDATKEKRSGLLFGDAS